MKRKEKKFDLIDWLYPLPEGRSLAALQGWHWVVCHYLPISSFLSTSCQLFMKYRSTENMHTVIVTLHYFLFSFNLSSFMFSLFPQLVNTCLDVIIQKRNIHTARATWQYSILPCQGAKQLLWCFPIFHFWLVNQRSWIPHLTTSTQFTNLVSDQVTPPSTCCFHSPSNGCRPSMSDQRLEPSLWTYLVLLIQSGILPYSPNSLPTASKANATHGFLTPPFQKSTCDTQQNPFISSPACCWLNV